MWESGGGEGGLSRMSLRLRLGSSVSDGPSACVWDGEEMT